MKRDLPFGGFTVQQHAEGPSNRLGRKLRLFGGGQGIERESSSRETVKRVGGCGASLSGGGRRHVTEGGGRGRRRRPRRARRGWLPGWCARSSSSSRRSGR